jgi:hypothetical protein
MEEIFAGGAYVPVYGMYAALNGGRINMCIAKNIFTT